MTPIRRGVDTDCLQYALQRVSAKRRGQSTSVASAWWRPGSRCLAATGRLRCRSLPCSGAARAA
ncbi:hypothetical protein DB799_15475, partial [Xanthomonas perforans]